MTDRDAPIILVEDHGYPLVSIERVPPPDYGNTAVGEGGCSSTVAVAGALAALFLAGFALGWIVATAAPRGALVIPAVATAAVPVAEKETSQPDRELPGASPVLPPTGDAPIPVVGVASWYAADGLVAAAGPRLRTGHWRGRVVTVSTDSGRSVRVRLVDWCQCYGTRLLDLSDDAFARLAPLSRGLLRVSVSGLPASKLPDTDR